MQSYPSLNGRFDDSRRCCGRRDGLRGELFLAARLLSGSIITGESLGRRSQVNAQTDVTCVRAAAVAASAARGNTSSSMLDNPRQHTLETSVRITHLVVKLHPRDEANTLVDYYDVPGRRYYLGIKLKF